MWVILSSCWVHNVGSNGLSACGTNAGYCIEKCQVCYSGGFTVKSNCSYVTIGTPACDYATGAWVQGTCYRIHCGL
jgi:hypothetical protein